MCATPLRSSARLGGEWELERAAVVVCMTGNILPMSLGDPSIWLSKHIPHEDDKSFPLKLHVWPWLWPILRNCLRAFWFSVWNSSAHAFTTFSLEGWRSSHGVMVTDDIFSPTNGRGLEEIEHACKYPQCWTWQGSLSPLSFFPPSCLTAFSYSLTASPVLAGLPKRIYILRMPSLVRPNPTPALI